MIYRLKILFLVAIFLFAAVGCNSSGGSQGSGDSDNGTSSKIATGFALSPEGFPADFSKILEFYEEVAAIETGSVMWNGAWREDIENGTDAGEAPEAAVSVFQGSRSFGLVPVIVYGWRTGDGLILNVPDDPTNNWTNTAARILFLDMLIEFVTEHNPPFLFIGNENDFYYEQNPDDYANWISFYNEAYDAIKATSINTQVGTVFNFEHLAGSGALNGWTTPHWEALESHDLSKIDIIGLTVYPWFNFETPEMVPGDYLAPLFSRVGPKPIAITETGWPAENLGGLTPSWETSEAAQVVYLSRLSAMLEGAETGFVNWLFLYPLQNTDDSIEWKLFGSISVRDFSGNKRAVYDQWFSFSP